MNKFSENNILFAVVFFAILLFLGYGADRNMYEYKVNGKTEANYKYIESLRTDFATHFSANFPYKMAFIDINGGMRNLFGQRYMNNVVKLNNGYITAIKGKIPDEKLVEEADNIEKLSSFCEDNHIPFLYVAAPDKVSPYDLQIPSGFTDYSNANIDIFLNRLKEKKVPYIDLRISIKEDNLNQYDLFAKTDHHWNSMGGYYGYSKIRQWFDKMEIDYDVIASKKENYNIDEYKGKLLGSWGQRTGKSFAGTDSLFVYRPLFLTNVTLLDNLKTGTYDEMLINREVLDGATPDFIYDAVFDNTRDVMNNLVENDTTVIMISDSFSRVVNPFIILTVKNFCYASTYDSKRVTKEYILSRHPDAVILLQSPWNNYGSDSSFQFITD